MLGLKVCTITANHGEVLTGGEDKDLYKILGWQRLVEWQLSSGQSCGTQGQNQNAGCLDKKGDK